jgi:23S rRNA pseudouridine955/2504/2580 synthase
MRIEPIHIIRETDNWVAIHKPPYVPSLPERGVFTAESVQDWGRRTFGDAILCHRIDRETSGILLLAKNTETHRHFSMQFEHRKVQKIYHAIVNGRIDFQDFTVDLPINTEHVKKIRIDKQWGKPALTVFNTLQVFKHFSLMECRPQTGRLHQIRVHLASQNASIAADQLYGSRVPMLSQIKRKISGEDRPLMERFALHAYGLQLTDTDGQPLQLIADYPKDFEVFLKLLNRYDLP